MDIKHSNILVSVVMPACNSEAFIEEAVRSVLNQTIRDLELIVIDDGSTDGTRAVVEEIAREDPRIRLVINEENMGVAKSRNHGLDLCSGVYTALLDSDDYWNEDFLEKKDKYSYFLGGNQPLCVIESEKNDGPKVLVIRDSYSDSLAPFLTEEFSEVHLFDVRYNMMSPSQYVQQNDIDQVIVLYSFNNFVQGQNFFTVGR